jgi:hypothetical protein
MRQKTQRGPRSKSRRPTHHLTSRLARCAGNRPIARRRARVSRSRTPTSRTHRGTQSSNPLPSSGESENHRFRPCCSRAGLPTQPCGSVARCRRARPDKMSNGQSGGRTFGRRWPPSRDRWFESASLQQRVREPSVPQLQRPSASGMDDWLKEAETHYAALAGYAEMRQSLQACR